ncbi:flagella synthesis protein FlgN [Gilliamella sp. M0364]|uniref:flagella synthesis protein FlgN n=1 Tax=Gilliamella sp. M0364 TaxID=2751011 RepID=UPI0018DC0DA3|nr:flagellar export chaperone FlgN [Gilliamella sp. M0364]MBI0157119.1 flagellar export chaperone FlgN [Gilliamella sp. M0364]
MLELDNIFNNVTVMLQSLSDILESEQQILIGTNTICQLNDVINQKSQLLIELKLLDEKRLKVSARYNIQSPYSENPELALKWQAITNTTQRLAQINRDNGILIQNRMNMTQQSIDYLKSINNPAVYTYHGYQQPETISSKRAKV